MSRLLTPFGERGREESTEPSTGDDESSGGGLRKTVLALGLLGLAYVAGRRMRSSGGPHSADRRRETTDDAGPGDVRPGEGRESFSEESEGTGAGDGRETEATAREVAEDGDQGATGSDDESLPGADRTPEEIEQRAEADAHEEPAEPGEMTVDEDVVEDIVDDEESSGEAFGEDGERDDVETDEGEIDAEGTDVEPDDGNGERP